MKFIHPKPLSNSVEKTSKSSDFEVEYAVPTSFPLEIKNKTQKTTQYCKCKKGCSNNHCNAEKWVIIVTQIVPVLTIIAKIYKA